MISLTHLREDCEGGTMVEFTIVLLPLLLVIGGIVDFGFVFWQLNMATKAVERGARIAAVSDPVATGLADIPTGTGGGALPADFDFYIKCEDGACSSGGYDADAMNTIVYGRGNGACNPAEVGPYNLGMCNVFNRVNPAGAPLTPANVVVEYRAAPEVGFQGRPCGPVATITVSLKNVTFGYFFLGGLMKVFDSAFPSIVTFPPMLTTITSEDLSTTSPLGC
jgi:hypothetical protein